MPRDSYHAYWIITADPDVMDCIQRMRIPGKILIAEQAKHGTEAMYHLEYISSPNGDYDFLTTLDAFMAMGARVYGMLPARKAPPGNN